MDDLAEGGGEGAADRAAALALRGAAAVQETQAAVTQALGRQAGKLRRLAEDAAGINARLRRGDADDPRQGPAH